MTAAYLRGPDVPLQRGRPQCDGKFPYLSWDSANRIARETLKAALEPYRCPTCCKWHIAGIRLDVPRSERVNRKLSDRGKRIHD